MIGALAAIVTLSAFTHFFMIQRKKYAWIGWFGIVVDAIILTTLWVAPEALSVDKIQSLAVVTVVGIIVGTYLVVDSEIP